MKKNQNCLHCDKPATVELSSGTKSVALCQEHWEAAVDRVTGKTGKKTKRRAK